MLTVATEVSPLVHTHPDGDERRSRVFPAVTVPLKYVMVTVEPSSTFISQVADLFPLRAVILAVPSFLAVTIPELSTVATLVSELDQLTDMPAGATI